MKYTITLSFRNEGTTRLLVPLNSSPMNVGRASSSSLNGTELSFDAIQAEVGVFVDCWCTLFQLLFPLKTGNPSTS